MSETQGISTEQRNENKVQYVGKRLYTFLVEIKNVLHEAEKQGVKPSELGIFAEFDVEGHIAAAREIGQVPVWTSDAAKETRKLTYKLNDGAKPVAQ